VTSDASDLRDDHDDWSPGVYSWLQAWYAAQSNGDWEHQYGIEIGTLDNPGWRVQIDVIDTPLAGRDLPKLETYRSEHDWAVVWADGAAFHGACGPMNLGEVLYQFRRWAGDIPER
jgi:hypothetical protein